MSAKNLVTNKPQIGLFIIVYRNENGSVLAQQLPEQFQAWINHTKPFIMAGKVLGFFTNGLIEPLPHFRSIVIVNPVFIPGIIRRVDINTLDLSSIIRQQRFVRLAPKPGQVALV